MAEARERRQAKARNRATARPPSWHWLGWIRRSVQWGAIVLLCGAPWAAVHCWPPLQGSFFALHIFGIPFADPLSALQPLLLGIQVAASLWTGALLTLMVALLLGRVFCGWICPYGLLSEYAHRLWPRAHGGLGQSALARECPRKDFRECPREDFRECPREDFPENHRENFHGKLGGKSGGCLGGNCGGRGAGGPLRRWGPLAIRSLVGGLGLAAAVWAGFPLLQYLSMPGELSLLPLRAVEGTAGQGLAGGSPSFWALSLWALSFWAVPLVVLLAEVLWGRRLWCTWLCPQSAALSWAALLGSRLFGGRLPHVRWSPRACTCASAQRGAQVQVQAMQGFPCEQACTLGLKIRQPGGPCRAECSQCLACVRGCQQQGGALTYGFARRPGSGAASGQHSGQAPGQAPATPAAESAGQSPDQPAAQPAGQTAGQPAAQPAGQPAAQAPLQGPRPAP